MGMAIDFRLPAAMSWVTQQNEPGTNAKDVIINRFQYVTDFVEDSRVKLAASLARLEGSAGRVEVGNIAIGEITVPDITDEIPSFVGLFTDTFNAELADFAPSYIEPVDMPDGTGIVWEEPLIALEPELVSQLAFWLVSGKSAIPDELANQIANSAQVRLAEKRTEAVLLLESEAASKGFVNPSFVDWNRRVQIEAEYAKGVTEISAKIAERDMELTQANYQKAMEISSAYVAAAKEYIIKKNLAVIQHYKARVDAWVALVDARIKEMQGRVDAFKGQVEAYVAKGQVFKVKAEVFESTVNAYTAVVGGLKVKFETIAETVKMKTKVFEVEATAAIEEEKLRVQAQIANSSFTQKVAESMAQLNASMVSHGLSSVHVQGGMSASHSTGQSVGYNYSRAENMSEQHSESISYNENP